MDISGPSHVLFRDGKPSDIYLVTATTNTMMDICVTSYYFQTVEEAELYLKYLQQVDGLKELSRILRSKKIPEYEKKGYREFKDSLQPEILETIAKGIKPEIIVTRYKRKK